MPSGKGHSDTTNKKKEEMKLVLSVMYDTADRLAKTLPYMQYDTRRKWDADHVLEVCYNQRFKAQTYANEMFNKARDQGRRERLWCGIWEEMEGCGKSEPVVDAAEPF